jgi:hypothetical protein
LNKYSVYKYFSNISFLGVVGGGLVRSRSIGGLLGSVGLVVGLTLVPHISDVSRVGISNVVGNNLGAAIGKVDTVLSGGGVVITVLVGGEVGSRVVISDSITVLVDSRAFILGFSVVRGSGLVVGGGRGVVGGLSVVGWGRVVRSRLVGGGRGISWLVGGSISWFVCRGSMVDGGSVVDWGRMVRSGPVGAVRRLVSGGTAGGSVLLLVVGLLDLVGLGRGLAHDSGVGNAMGFVHRGVDGGGIAVLDALMAALVSGGKSQEGEDCDESLGK